MVLSLVSPASAAFQIIDGELVTPENQGALLPTLTNEPAPSANTSGTVKVQTAQNTRTGEFCRDFNRPLRLGDSGIDVRGLHNALEIEGFKIQGDFNVFTKSTEDAVKKFQEKYRDETLTPAGVTAPTGFVGSATRAKLNAIYRCTPAAQSSAAASVKATAPIRLAVPELSAEDLVTLSSKAELTATFNAASTEDQAGSEGVFMGGPGNKIKNITDFSWNATLTTETPKVVRSVSLYHLVPGEAWSTSRAPIATRQPYPLVVFKDGKKINSEYDQTLWTTGTGETFTLYGQPIGTEAFFGGKLVVMFSDGTAAVARIMGDKAPGVQTAASRTQVPAIGITSPNDGAVWSAGTLQDVSWQSRVIPTILPVMLRLRSVSTGAETILDDGGAMNNGLATVKVPDTIASGEYYVEIKAAYDAQSYIDSSDRPILVTSKGQTVSRETVTCTFANARGAEKCYSSDGNWGCSGTPSCSAPVVGLTGSKIMWKSSCGAGETTTVDGTSQEIKFVCRSKEPFIKILSPNGGESFKAGSQQKITWEIGNPDDIIGLYLLPVNIAISNSLAALPESRTFVWDVPKNLPTQSDYKVEARLYRTNELGIPRFVGSDQSDKGFSITGGVVATTNGLTVLSPNGGDGWTVGKSYTISFTGAPTEAPLQVYLERYHPDGTSKEGISGSVLIGEVKAGQSTLTYAIPPEVSTWPGVGGEYKIKACYDNCNSQDSSDAYFSITPVGTVAGASTTGRDFYISQAATVFKAVGSFFGELRSFLR